MKLLDISQFKAARDRPLRAWLSAAKQRELPRIGNSPNGYKEWLHSRGIKDGEWFTSTKPQFEQQMQAVPGHTLKSRIWAVGILATDNFKGELAVKLIQGGKIMPLTSNDIRKKLNDAAEKWAQDAGLVLTDRQKKVLHVGKQDIRRALAGLELEGKALRTLRDGTPLCDLPLPERKRLQEGDILLFFFLRPLSPEPRTVLGKCPPLFASCSPLKRVARTLKFIELSLEPQTVVGSDPLMVEFDAAEGDYRKTVSAAKDAFRNRFSVAAQRELTINNSENNHVTNVHPDEARSENDPTSQPLAAGGQAHTYTDEEIVKAIPDNLC